ncbi:MAG: SPFH domain-containing protein [Anaerolineae bacterium]|jgi:membrane protease subunit (stomatin/prohibitin family)
MARILDIVQAPDMGPRDLVRRVPQTGAGDFRIGTQLIVREGQMAVFFRDGKALDTFGPGRHTLTTANIPLLVNLVQTIFSGDTPFTAEVYFVNTRDFMDMRWGTPEPITLRDEVLRMVRVRAHGTYNMAIADPQLFVNQVVGARGYYSTEDITNYLRSMVINRLTDLLGTTVRSVLDLPSMFEEISAAARVRLRDDFAAVGMGLKQLYILSISPTEETSAAIDEAASMGAIGDMDRYMKFKTARAVGDAATAESGTAAGTAQMGLGMGAGLAAAQAMASSFAARPPEQPAAAPAPAQPAANDPVAALSTLKSLLDNGLISQEEYDAKRKDILSRL